MTKHHQSLAVGPTPGLLRTKLRTKRVTAGLALGLGLTLCQGAVAGLEQSDFRFDSTQDLHAICSAPESAAEFAIARQACRAFIEGVAQYHDLVTKPGKLHRLVCMPPGATVEDGVRAFNDWAAAKAADAKVMAEPPALGLVRALADKYPCKR